MCWVSSATNGNCSEPAISTATAPATCCCSAPATTCWPATRSTTIRSPAVPCSARSEVTGTSSPSEISTATAPTTLGQIGSEWHFLDAGDFNNDGTSDLLWQRESDQMLLMQQVNGNQIG